jgi:hypothetical protein
MMTIALIALGLAAFFALAFAIYIWCSGPAEVDILIDDMEPARPSRPSEAAKHFAARRTFN